MNQTICWSILVLALATQITLPAKIYNIQDLQKLAEEGDSNAQCLLGLQEMIGGDLYDPRIIDTVTVEQILLNKVEKWRDLIRFLPTEGDKLEIKTGSKAEEAFKWVKKSAQQGNKIALYCLGIFFMSGLGVEKDYDQAYENFEKSAELGFTKSCVPLKNLCVRKNDTNQAAVWILRGYDAGDLDCKVELGYMFLGGLGVEKNEKKGFEYIEEAYRMGNKPAIGRLGDCYLNGWGTSKDLSKAFTLFKEGSATSETCKLRLGQMYLKGEGTGKDEQRGLALIEEVAAAGKGRSSEAKLYLGRIYANGWGVSVSRSKALEFFEQAANEGNVLAMVVLGNAYYEGRPPLSKNIELAKDWLQKAKDRGNKQASELLEKIEIQQKN